MMDFELAIKNEKERHEAAMVGILDMLESTVVTKLKKCGNFMILPHDEDVSVKIVDGAGRNVVYNVYAVGLTTDDRVIYVTSEALYDEWDREYDMNDEYKTEDGSWTETFVKKSKYWWFFEYNVRKYNILSNKENVLINVLRILTDKKL